MIQAWNNLEKQLCSYPILTISEPFRCLMRLFLINNFDYVQCLVLIFQQIIVSNIDNHISKYHTNGTSVMLVNHIYINYFILRTNVNNCYWFFSVVILQPLILVINSI